MKRMISVLLAICLAFSLCAAGAAEGATPDYGGAKARLESRHWGYGGIAAEIETSFKAELWDLMSHEFDGMFADEAACGKAVTSFSTSPENTNTEISGVSYYTAEVTLNAGVVASLKVYVLSGTEECVVKYGNSFQILNAGTSDIANKLDVTTQTEGQGKSASTRLSDVQLDIGNAELPAVEIFGNGVMANTMAASGYHAVWHITPPPSLTPLSHLNFILAVYKTGFIGAKITASNDGGTAAAWDSMGQYPVVPLNSSSEWGVFFGNTSVTIGSVVLSATFGAVTDVALADGTPAAAATITDNKDGTWKVTFGSAFYDEVPLTITVGGTPYPITLRRVGIGIQGIGRGQGDKSCTINQGTQPGSTLTWADDDQYAVVATFYYPNSMFSSAESSTAVNDGFGGTFFPWKYTIPDRVSLVVNYVYQDGRTETKIVDTWALTADVYGYFVPADDFILYQGSLAGAPASVYVTAILDSDSDTFGGAKFGSGSGVSWTFTARD